MNVKNSGHLQIFSFTSITQNDPVIHQATSLVKNYIPEHVIPLTFKHRVILNNFDFKEC